MRNDYLTQLNSIGERHRNEGGGQFNFQIRNTRNMNYIFGDETLLIAPYNKNDLIIDRN